jgi:3-dehydroquinate dehydratase
MSRLVYVLNGPNLKSSGRREPHQKSDPAA